MKDREGEANPAIYDKFKFPFVFIILEGMNLFKSQPLIII
jgi:hypothetical protein